MKDKPEIKVGSIVKKSYSSVRKPTQRERAEYKYSMFLPVAGIVKKIYQEDLPGIEEGVVAEIDWFNYEVPELNAIADPWELDFERRRRHYGLQNLSLFEPYYKALLKRVASKKRKKESSLQQRKTVVE